VKNKFSQSDPSSPPSAFAPSAPAMTGEVNKFEPSEAKVEPRFLGIKRG
jgi:hypothetical protein